jgi:hypothetical protein
VARVYVLSDDGSAREVAGVHCKNEERELQQLLEANPHIMPGHQIDPENPRHFIVIRREMAVPDPGTAEDRWSVDLVLADQDAIPTLVECKRFCDTRSRREVVGQMLDDAANGQFYWDSKSLEQAARAHRQSGGTLEEDLADLAPAWAEDVDGYFEQMEFNLREGQVRLVFFLEDAPPELKSIADFLNRQMERTEVLVVEARQFDLDGQRIVAPQLFGFTEEPRRVKRIVEPVRTPRTVWNEEKYFAAVTEYAGQDTADAIQRLYDLASSEGFAVRWRTGKEGSFKVCIPSVMSASLLSVYSSGETWINLRYMTGSPKAEQVSSLGVQMLTSAFGMALQRKALRPLAERESTGLEPQSNRAHRLARARMRGWSGVGRACRDSEQLIRSSVVRSIPASLYCRKVR